MRRQRNRFPGTIQALMQIVAVTGVPGVWELMPNDFWRYLCDDRAILNWWPSTGTYQFQGPKREREAFEEAIIAAVGWLATPRPALPYKRKPD